MGVGGPDATVDGMLTLISSERLPNPLDLTRLARGPAWSHSLLKDIVTNSSFALLGCGRRRRCLETIVDAFVELRPSQAV